MRSKPLVLAVVCMVVLNTGCATILSGRSQRIIVTSKPRGAHVKIGDHRGTTPARFDVLKGKKHVVEVSLDSEIKQVQLRQRFDVVCLLNIIFWPGFIVDALAGCMFVYHPDHISVDFANGQSERR